MLSIDQQIRLQTWFGSSFPTGAFSYSHGLETAIHVGMVNDAVSCQEWLEGLIEHGSLWNDVLFTNLAHVALSNREHANLLDINNLALALSAGAERYAESTQIGSAFLNAATPGTAHKATLVDLLGDNIALPVSIGAVSALFKLPSESVLAASLQASSSNLVWIGTRLIPLGQSSALQIIENLASTVAAIAQRAQQSTGDDLGNCSVMSDIMSMQHEVLSTRICLT